MTSNVVVYMADWCPDCRRTLAWLNERGIEYETRDVDQDKGASKRAEEANYGKRVLPVVEIRGKVYVRPKDSELTHALGLELRGVRKADCVIVGGGAAGLTAALYLARELVDVVVLEAELFGGQINTTDRVENYPGFPEGVGGYELSEKLANQAKRFGAELISPLRADTIDDTQDGYEVTTGNGRFQAPTVILCTGSNYRRLDVPGARELVGYGLSYCATCDGPFFRNKKVVVVGGGNTAVDEAIFLTRFVDRVYLVHRRDRLTAEARLVNELKETGKAEFIANSSVKALRGEKRVESVLLENTVTREERNFDAEGVFVFIGREPNTAFLKGFLELDESGFIAVHGHVRTSREGVYSAGDCNAGSAGQVTTAVGDATLAAFAARDRFAESRRKANRSAAPAAR